jgi:hypothetical protein
MKIENVAVYGLNESIIASGYPMMKENQSLRRAEVLGNAMLGSGHDCFLKGITVQADVTAPQYWWLQFQRYHFADIISSESKMHCITKMNLEERCNSYVHEKILHVVDEILQIYKKDPSPYKFQVLIANIPMGLKLKARITTNYLQLKTMYYQRHNHKLKEWRTFCSWMEELPLFKKIVVNGDRTSPNG